MPPRQFPTNPPGFEQAWSTYYTSMEELANTLLRAFAVSLDLDSNFFEGKRDYVYIYIYIYIYMYM